jgi:RNA-binding protein
MNLTKEQQKYLRSRAHVLDPVIWIGQHGLTTNVMEEINIALDHHELVKMKLRVGDRVRRDRIITEICDRSSAQLIQKTGNTAVLFRRNDTDPVIKLP